MGAGTIFLYRRQILLVNIRSAKNKGHSEECPFNLQNRFQLLTAGHPAIFLTRCRFHKSGWKPRRSAALRRRCRHSRPLATAGVVPAARWPLRCARRPVLRGCHNAHPSTDAGRRSRHEPPRHSRSRCGCCIATSTNRLPLEFRSMPSAGATEAYWQAVWPASNWARRFRFFSVCHSRSKIRSGTDNSVE
jgi:hypothetical protein